MSFEESLKIGTYGEELVQNYFESIGYTVMRWSTEKSHKFDLMCENNGRFILAEVKTKPHMTVGKYNGLTGIDFDVWEKYNKVKDELGKPFYLFFVDALHGSIRFGEFNIISEPTLINDIIYPMDCLHFKNPMTLFHPDQLTLVRKLTNEECHWLKVRSKSKSF